VASAPLTVRIHLDETRVPMGRALRGEVIYTNATRSTLTVTGCPAITIGLARPNLPFDPAVTTEWCVASTRVAPGSHRQPITGYTTYTGCGGGPASAEPSCPRFGIPLLPLGAYSVKVLTSGLPKGTVVIPPGPVTIVNAQTGSASGAASSAILVEATGCRGPRAKVHNVVAVRVRVWLDGRIVARATGSGVGQFAFAALPHRRYVVQTSGHRGGAVETAPAVESFINLFAHC
jgi:hypothetical protein